MITFNQLTQQYTPGNTSTNFSNNTCRRRLLDKYIGAGKWEYVFEGRKAVGINILGSEPEPKTEPEPELKTVADVDTEIARCKNRITELETRIAELKILKTNITPSYIRFKNNPDFKFRAFGRGADEDINKIFEAGTEFYENHKNETNMHETYSDFLVSYAKILKRHVQHLGSEIYTDHKFSGYTTDRNFWRKKFEEIFACETDQIRASYMRFESLEAVKRRIIDKANFTEHQSDVIAKYSPMLKQALTRCKMNSKASAIIQKLLDLETDKFEQIKKLKREAQELAKEFEAEYLIWKLFDSKQYRNKKSNSNSHKRTFRTKTYKYFTGIYETADDLKTEYKKLSRKYHPDMSGGSTEKFQEMSNEYEQVKKDLRFF